MFHKNKKLYCKYLPRENKAQIGYTYDDGTVVPSHAGMSNKKSMKNDANPSVAIDSESDDEYDLGMCCLNHVNIVDRVSKNVHWEDIQFDIDKMDPENRELLNKCAVPYGMKLGEFVRMLQLDKDEAEKLRQQRLLEAEKAQYSVTTFFLALKRLILK